MAGHFPGNPIVPGALLLEAVLQAIEAQAGARFSACAIRSAKFLHPVRPGERVEIRWTPLASGEIKFECSLDGRTVLAGSLKPIGAAA